MRAVICRDLTGIDGLALVTDWPEPQPAAGEVVIGIKAATRFGPVDDRAVPGSARPPFVGSSSRGGLRGGRGVTRLRVGDRVVAACGRNSPSGGGKASWCCRRRAT
jgi:NADPH2:quinone reductase